MDTNNKAMDEYTQSEISDFRLAYHQALEKAGRWRESAFVLAGALIILVMMFVAVGIYHINQAELCNMVQATLTATGK